MGELRRAIFVVRLSRDDLGRITGVVERVRTGEKARVDSLGGIGDVLAEMFGREDAERFRGDSQTIC